MRGHLLGLALLLACLAGFRPGLARAATPPPDAPSLLVADLVSYSLEALMQIEIVSASKRAEPLADIPAAVFVVTSEDIRRSGATHLGDVLRMVPGMYVGRSNTHEWAISARGFADFDSNKLLTLVDGRTIYSPLFSGTFWDEQDLVLEDIERIEVIRGPGGVIWGSNAVNGVINIITKNSADSQGTYASFASGHGHPLVAEASHGTRIESLAGEATLRISGKGFQRDPEPAGQREDYVFSARTDDFTGGRVGARMDWKRDEDTDLMLKAEFLAQTLDVPTQRLYPEPPYTAVEDDDQTTLAAYLQGQFSKRLGRTRGAGDLGELTIQYSSHVRDSGYQAMEYLIATHDLEARHALRLSERHDLSYGLAYRLVHDNYKNTYENSLDPSHKVYHLLALFAQDTISLAEDTDLVLGGRLEYDGGSGISVQPTARLFHRIDPDNAVWFAVSRAVRRPSRIDHDYANAIVRPNGLTVINVGNEDFSEESLVSLEAGYRAALRQNLSLDLALFQSFLDGANISSEAERYYDEASDTLFVVYSPENGVDGEVRGAELALDFTPSDLVRLKAAYTYTDINLWHATDSTDDLSLTMDEQSAPEHYVSLRAWLDLREDLSLDLWLRHCSKMSHPLASNNPAYTEVDARLGYQLSPVTTLELIGQNLLNEVQHEFFYAGSSRKLFARVSFRL